MPMSESKLARLTKIDHLQSSESIQERLDEIDDLSKYGNDWSQQLKPIVDTLKERKRALETSG